ncbi:MAG: hypothetical protein FJX53_13045, partial [Alphaproteobacteria bacterium]|nr:hypothetical protein [Alphaproteobacteria bacterium]
MVTSRSPGGGGRVSSLNVLKSIVCGGNLKCLRGSCAAPFLRRTKTSRFRPAGQRNDSRVAGLSGGRNGVRAGMAAPAPMCRRRDWSAIAALAAGLQSSLEMHGAVVTRRQSVTGMARLAACLVLAFATIVTPPPAVAQQRLPDSVVPVQQHTHVWCWLAVGEMVFRHYGIPTANHSPYPAAYQCGIVGSLAYQPPNVHPCVGDCGLCTVPAGSAQGVVYMLRRYPVRAGGPFIDTVYRPQPLSLQQVRAEIDAGNPVIVGISPSGRPPAFSSEHVAVVAGYDLGTGRVLVYDPYPFAGPWANPYLPAGAQQAGPLSYWIDIAALVAQLQWHETFTLRRIQLSLPAHCCVAGGRYSPFPNPVTVGTGMDQGEMCYVTDGWGR